MSVQQPYTVDPTTGNISINGRSGLYMVINFTDSLGANIDVSASAIYFEVKGCFRVALLAGAQNYQRILALSQPQVSQLSSTQKPFILKNEDNVVDGIVYPSTYWEGLIEWRGFTATPVSE